jgi:hypothetical protein
MTHRAHPGTVQRLKRAGEHLHQIIAMIEEGWPCRELAQQLQAVENAIYNAKKVPDPRSHRALPRSLYEDAEIQGQGCTRRVPGYNKIPLTAPLSPASRRGVSDESKPNSQDWDLGFPSGLSPST